ncbi:0c496204-b818-41cf-b582-cc5a1e979571 [Sclerotinia trifoliorum]|uniref:alpha,alpha-trehalase n=1 Tax=Sclerotinia trifoliorum TaxID=28548 RepID=A0A8H2VXN7_9HELO|nr:0c496204-b818-41cf-b582-cc5a1e979571 [Sclerotinia trifoliorum]
MTVSRITSHINMPACMSWLPHLAVVTLLPAVAFGADYGEEVNPASQFKTKTIPDGTMPRLPDFGVLAENSLSRWDDQNLTLTTNVPILGNFLARMHLSNGYIGLAEASLGPFFEKDFNQTCRDGKQPTEPWPEFNPRQTFSGIVGFFDRQHNTTATNYPELLDRGDESVISGIPHFTDIYFTVGEQVLNATVDLATITDYSSSLNLMDATARWSYTWTPIVNGSSSFEIEYLAFISAARINVAAIQLNVTPLNGTTEKVTITDSLDGRSAVRSFLGQKGNDAASIYVSNHPNGLQNVSAWTVSTANFSSSNTNSISPRSIVYPNDDTMTIGQEWEFDLKSGQPVTFHKFVGIASTDKYPNAQLIASQASRNATNDGWDVILAEHTAIWNRRMERKVVDYRNPATGHLPINDTLAEVDQINAAVSRYVILQTLLPEDDSNLNDNGVGVGGITADPYGGMTFWDMDIWMFPGIALTDPDYALQMIKYRVKMYAQAKVNAQEAYVQEKYKFDNDSVLYSWTSGRYGNATGTGPTLDYEYHINTDVAKMMLDYRRITNNEEYFKEELWPVVKSVGHTIEGVLQKDDHGKWNIWNMTDPDEWTNHVKNGAFTQASFFQIMNSIISIKKQYDETIPATWLDIVENITIPVSSSGITLEYEEMPSNITVKQADVTLLLHPLSLPESSKAINYTLERKQADLQYYTQKQSLHGPAMTFAINTIATLRYGGSGCSASTYNKMGVLSNLRAPWFLMSEQANDDTNANGGYPPAFPFLTGHGGTMQIAFYGYLGLDSSQDVLTIQPTLPPPKKYLTMHEFTWAGCTFSASMSTTHTNITFTGVLPSSSNSQNTTSVPMVQNLPASRHPQIHHTLSLNQTYTLENDMYWQGLTTPNNLLQCLSIIASDASELNRWPESVNDGDVGTSWQPENTNESSISIDTSPVQGERIKIINVVWGQRIPTSAIAVVFNSTNPSEGHIFPLPLPDLKISDVANIKTIKDIDSLSDITSSKDSPYGNGEEGAGDDVRLEEGLKTTYTLPDDKLVYMGDTAVLRIAGCLGSSCGVFGDEAGATVEEWEIIGEA